MATETSKKAEAKGDVAGRIETKQPDVHVDGKCANLPYLFVYCAPPAPKGKKREPLVLMTDETSRLWTATTAGKLGSIWKTDKGSKLKAFVLGESPFTLSGKGPTIAEIDALETSLEVKEGANPADPALGDPAQGAKPPRTPQ